MDHLSLHAGLGLRAVATREWDSDHIRAWTGISLEGLCFV